MWSNRFFEVICGQIVRAFEAGFRPQNARKWAISGEKQRKKETLSNLPFLEREEDIDIKIRSVSNRKFLFQSQIFCFKVNFFVSK